jgi:hypothetical protein
METYGIYADSDILFPGTMQNYLITCFSIANMFHLKYYLLINILKHKRFSLYIAYVTAFDSALKEVVVA